MPRGRKGQTPTDARIDSETRIKKALEKGDKKTNKQLFKETHLSEPTLAKRLADLQARGKIIVEFSNKDDKDRRKKWYSLTIEGYNDLIKESLKNDINTIPLIMNERSIRRRNKFSKQYIKRRGWDKVKKTPRVLTETTPLSPIFELEDTSDIFKEFKEYIYKQFFDLMKKRYPEFMDRQITDKRNPWMTKEINALTHYCSLLTRKFFDVISANYYLSLFSFLKVKPPGVAEYDLGVKATLLSPFKSPLKMDFFTEKYVKFFEQFLEILHEIMVQNNYSIEDLFVEGENSKIMMIFKVDFSNLSWNMKRLEENFFQPEKHWKRLQGEEPELFGPDAKPISEQLIKEFEREKPKTKK